jgi:CRISPR system Cascade subunit CasB
MTAATNKDDPHGSAGTVIQAVIPNLQRGYRGDLAGAVAQVAQLRNAAGQAAAAVPEMWGSEVLDEVYKMAEKSRMREPEALNLEFAVLTAASLWAYHQQSIRDENMHRPDGRQLGASVRRLMPDGTDTPARKRLVRAGESTSRTELSGRLTDVVAVLRRGRIHLDYAVLADQLLKWTQRGGPDDVRAAWGRSFARPLPKPAPASMEKDSKS